MATSMMHLSATALADALRSGELSAREAVTATLEAIETQNPQSHAFISIDAEASLQTAERLDEVQESSQRGALHGVPIAVKDVTDVRGFATTQGSLTTGREAAQRDELSVARLRSAGAIIVGKTNTPEFGFGAVCTNKVAGPTLNPWGQGLTSGGSSGGSAVAVTTGMVPLAQGADFGGSVRTPASFCGCVGLRPTPGSIPEPHRPLAWNTLATQGILARDVDDAALMLRVMAGADPMDPTSAHADHAPASRPVRVAASADLGGQFLIDPAVRGAFTAAVDRASEVLGPIAESAPPLPGATEAFTTLRAAQSWFNFRDLVTSSESELTESFVWNVRRGREITAEQYLDAEQARGVAYRSFQSFFEGIDILLLPAASVLPFPIEQGEVTQIAGVPTDSIIDYLACTYLISLVGFPALSLPALWTDEGLPFGLQLVARPGDEKTLLHAARELERRGGFHHRWPDVDL